METFKTGPLKTLGYVQKRENPAVRPDLRAVFRWDFLSWWDTAEC